MNKRIYIEELVFIYIDLKEKRTVIAASAVIVLIFFSIAVAGQNGRHWRPLVDQVRMLSSFVISVVDVVLMSFDRFDNVLFSGDGHVTSLQMLRNKKQKKKKIKKGTIKELLYFILFPNK